MKRIDKMLSIVLIICLVTCAVPLSSCGTKGEVFVTDKNVDGSDANADTNGHFYVYPSHTIARHGGQRISFLAVGGNIDTAPETIVRTKYREAPWNIELNASAPKNY